MYRKIFLLVLFFGLFILSSCGSGNDSIKVENEGAFDLQKELYRCKVIRLTGTDVFDPNECYASVANKISHLEDCEKLEESMKESCYLSVANIKSDESVCELVSGSNKNLCMALAKEDINLCIPYYGFAREPSADNLDPDCVYRFAVRTKDVSACKLLKDNPQSEINCASQIEAESKSRHIQCDTSTNEISKYTCQMELAYTKDDLKLCDDAGFFVDTCRLKIILNRQDESKCEIFKWDWEKLRPDTTAEEAREITKGIMNTQERFEYYHQCYYFIALMKQDEKLCEKAGRQSCYLHIALKKKDPTICEGAGESKDSCLADYNKNVPQ